MLNLSVFNKSYSAPKGNKENIYFSLLFGLFVAFFLIFFEPFDLDSANYPNKTLCLGFYGVISSFVLIMLFYVLPSLMPKVYSDKVWKVWHQILLLIAAVFLISTLNGIFINYLQDLTFNWYNYQWIIVRTFALASIPLSILVLLDYNRSLKLNLKEAKQIQKANDGPKEVKNLQQETILILDNNQEVQLPARDIIYIEADGNYLNVASLQEDQAAQNVYRTSLQRTLQDNDIPYLLRCHRSYLVNLQRVSNVTGNAQGLRLELSNCDKIIPVSRKYIPLIRSYFDQ